VCFHSEQSTPKKKVGNEKDAFQEFKEKTNDAWDDGEDDLMITTQFKMSLRDVQNTALQV